MKIAIATDGEMVSGHFGHCAQYTLVDIVDGQVKEKTVISNPGHKPDFLPGYLAERGVSCIIAGGMGPRAQELFAARNIQTIVGVTGSISDVISAYVANRLKSGESTCHHGEHEHC